MGGTPGIGGKPFDSGRLGRVRYTDKSQALTRGLLGINGKPDYDYTRLGLLFPQNDTSETINIIDQMPHEKKLGTDLRLHIHIIQETANLPIFIAEYKYYNQGADVPAAFTTISTADGAGPLFAWSGNPMLQIIRWPFIPAPANEIISANLDLKIYRNDNIIVGDVLAKFVDFHYQLDSDGSLEEFEK